MLPSCSQQLTACQEFYYVGTDFSTCSLHVHAAAAPLAFSQQEALAFHQPSYGITEWPLCLLVCQAAVKSRLVVCYLCSPQRPLACSCGLC